jgi:hypothetical protein
LELHKLTDPFVTPLQFNLPYRDAFGVFHGSGYEPLLNAEDMTLATRSTFGSVKFARVHEALNISQLKALLSLNFNSYVVDVREHYPIYEQSDYNQARLTGVRMQASHVKTCNIVLTLILPNNRIHYHGISIADDPGASTSDTSRPTDQVRAVMLKRGWTWERLRGDSFSRRACGNHLLMRSWITNVNVWNLHGEAGNFAGRLFTKSLRGTLSDVMRRHARHLCIPADHAYELFAIAVSFGFLYIDHEQDLRVDEPLHLKRPAL